MNLGLLVTNARDVLHYSSLYASLSHTSLKFRKSWCPGSLGNRAWGIRKNRNCKVGCFKLCLRMNEGFYPLSIIWYCLSSVSAIQEQESYPFTFWYWCLA